MQVLTNYFRIANRAEPRKGKAVPLSSMALTFRKQQSGDYSS